MENKTAIQELVDIMNKDQVSFTEWFLDNYKTYLQKEKQQIIDAHIEGWSDAYDYLKDDNAAPRQAIDYYEEIYK